MAKMRLGEVLLEEGVISQSQLDEAVQVQRTTHERLGDVLINRDMITERQLLEALEMQLGIPHVVLTDTVPDIAALSAVPESTMRRFMVVPVKVDRNRLVLAMVDPLDYFAIDDIRMLTGLQVQPVIASRDDVRKFLDSHFSKREGRGGENARPQRADDPSPSETPPVIDDNSPVVKTLNQIIIRAVQAQASDIHFDPGPNQLTVRFRIDGTLRVDQTLPKTMQSMVMARIKVLSNLDVAERRLPQDGRFRQTVDGKDIDIRVSTLPTIHDEKTVLRLFDLSRGLLRLERLGMTPENLKLTRAMLSSSSGMVLVSGPTGSGKTSTLYAAISECNRPDVNIVTIEDPVEYQIAGINQVAVNPAVGLTFSSGLRSVLRQDPDIIMVGEIRDAETAEIATRAALTGHLVLSTLHTGGAIESVTRLIEMGVEPFLVAASVRGVIAQRLVRRVCTDCCEPYTLTEAEQQVVDEIVNRKLSSEGERAQLLQWVHGKGCPSCSYTGYRGRFAIQEVMSVDEDLRRLILQGAPQDEIVDLVDSRGFRNLVYDGMMKAAQGATTVAEVIRVAWRE